MIRNVLKRYKNRVIVLYFPAYKNIEGIYLDSNEKKKDNMADEIDITNEEILDKIEKKDWFIPEDIRKVIEERLKELQNDLYLEVYIKEGENDPYNVFSTLFCLDLSRLSDKIHIKIGTIGDKGSEALDVTHSPTILINPDEYDIRYIGAPAGEEGRSFLETLIIISSAESGLTDQSKTALKALKEKRHVQVFVTPGCPYCPDQVLNANRAAVERPDLIRADCVEATENIELSKRYDVGAVPHTVINDKTIRRGLEPEEIFIEELLSLEPSKKIKEPSADIDEETEEVDLIIMGGGPAGLTAGIYAERSGLSSIILEKSVLGGQVMLTPVVDNYPGFTNIGGKQLMDLMSAHAKKYVHVHEGEEVLEIKIGKKIEALTNRGKYIGRGLIIATGAAHRKLDVSGEDTYNGIGVSYCATCDGYLFKDKKVIVVGGGNSALTDALFLKSLGANVRIIHRRDSLRAQKYLQEAVEREDIPIVWNTEVKEILGEDRKLTGVKIVNTKTKKESTKKLDGIFIAVGEDPNSKMAAEIGIKLKEGGFINVDQSCRTNIPRVYAAGDVTGGVRQIVTAVSEGSIAALAAFEDLMNPYWSKPRD